MPSPEAPRASPKLPWIASPLRCGPGPRTSSPCGVGAAGAGGVRAGLPYFPSVRPGFGAQVFNSSNPPESPLHTVERTQMGIQRFRIFCSLSSTAISLLTFRPVSPVSDFHLTVQRASQIQLVQLGNSDLFPHTCYCPSLPSQKGATSSFQLLGKKISELFSTPLFFCHHSSECLSKSCLHCLRNLSRICFSSPRPPLPPWFQATIFSCLEFCNTS